MTDKQILKRVNYWVGRMGLTDFAIEVKVINAPDSQNVAFTMSQPQYRRAVLTFNMGTPELLANLDWHITHELGHVLVGMLCRAVTHYVDDSQAKKVLDDLEDEVVTRIAEIMLREN